MPREHYYTLFETDAGWVGIVSSAAGLLSVTLPCPSPQTARTALGDHLDEATEAPRRFQDLRRRLETYLQGQRADFPDLIDLSGSSDFQKKVLAATRRIGYGERRSYGWVAQQIGQPQAVRAVGGALGKNPLPIIVPCHRVLAHDGRLCGFSGGIEVKQYLLDLESSHNGS